MYSRVEKKQLNTSFFNGFAQYMSTQRSIGGGGGRWESYKTGVKLKSSRLKNTAVKMLIYNLLLISSFIAETYLAPWIPFTKIALSFLALVEISSMGENFQKITGMSFTKYLKDYLNEKLNSTKNK